MKIKNEISTALFRILQEALTNVVQHSEANTVHVDLTVDESRVSLTVNDNGKGITDDEINSPTSLGLLGMRERVEFLQGSFSIAGQAGRGTTIRASIPVKSP